MTLTLTDAQRRHLTPDTELKGQGVLFTVDYVRTGHDGTWHDQASADTEGKD